MGTSIGLPKIAVSLAMVATMVAYLPVSDTTLLAQTKASGQRSTAQKTPAPATHKKPVAAAASKAAPKKQAYSSATARARRAELARARAAARARELKELQTPRFTVDEFGREVPDVRAEAAIIYNPETGEVLWENHSNDQRSIASITKVMTALVFLESATPLSTLVTVQRSDVARASTTYLRNGFKLTAEDLLNLLLVGSDNAAARALARVSVMGYTAFMQRMNDKAKELGLDSTTYADPSGLLADNVSSAYDQARLIAFAAADERLGAIMRKSSYSTTVGRRAITANNTNHMIRSGDIDVVGGKTGFISRSGYCLATLLRLPQSGQQVVFVVLGAKSNASRFWETRHLFNWMATRTRALLDGEFHQPQQQQDEDQ
ncbi:MAG: D-alanyl-D-alanine carboxypeptidase [Acidimicrobiia bacterium]|nr:D-alanyl-D-alanine carboxypeptidase [Acidimicrobiia bacterium]